MAVAKMRKSSFYNRSFIRTFAFVNLLDYERKTADTCL